MKATFHLRCVTLLHHLHSVVPKPRLIEKIIATDLNNVDTYQRFTLLWHLSRDLELKLSTKDQQSTFDICLLKMLDNLNMPGGPLKGRIYLLSNQKFVYFQRFDEFSPSISLSRKATCNIGVKINILCL